MNPAVVDAFALAISGAGGPPAYPDVPGHEPDIAGAQVRAARVTAAMDEIRKVAPRAGSYVWETDYFQPHWQEAFWGENYDRLLAVKTKYDPDGLFFLHHGVGSEDWSADGFTRAELTPLIALAATPAQLDAIAPLRTLMPYTPSPTRYDKMIYNRSGRSGLKLPAISLGLWHNFGFDKSADSMRAICQRAFDLGVTHFDLANNYGPPPARPSLPSATSCAATSAAFATNS